MDAVTRKARVGSSDGSGATAAETAGSAGQEAGRPTAIVVGAGVSGCACAAAMAAGGLHVTLMNSAMDRVGLPAYGPDLVGDEPGWDRLQEILRQVPSPLREVWLDAGMRPANGEPILNIDRRRVSVETKRLLERIPGLQFRQGFVTGLQIVDSGSGEAGSRGAGPTEPGPSKESGDAAGADRQSSARVNETQRVQVETIFGEVFEADVVVVAVGMSLAASTVVGTATVQGGRYGEPASEGLWTALAAMGTAFKPISVDVGPRVSVRDALAAGWPTERAESGPGGRVGGRRGAGQDASGSGCGSPGTRLVRAGAEASECWPVGYPPTVHEDDALRVDWIVTGPRAGKVEESESGPPTLSPDGAATAELYVAPRSPFVAQLRCAVDEDEGLVAARMPMSVSGKAVVGLSDGGRMSYLGLPGPVWIVGRAAGARDYAASLTSGVVAAGDIVKAFGARLGVGAPTATLREHGPLDPSLRAAQNEGGGG